MPTDQGCDDGAVIGLRARLKILTEERDVLLKDYLAMQSELSTADKLARDRLAQIQRLSSQDNESGG